MLCVRSALLTARLGAAAALSLIIALGSVPGTAAAAPTRITPAHLDTSLLQAAASNPSATVRVIITRDRGGDAEGAVNHNGGRVIGKLQLANATVAEVPASRLHELALQPGVARVSVDAPVTLQADPLSTCCADLQTVYPLAVDAASQWDSSRHLRGTGIGVAVIDSGITPSNPDFRGANLNQHSRIAAFINEISHSELSGIDDNGHGTFVSGIIGGRGWSAPGVASGSYIGIAPDANLISLKVSDSTGKAYVSDVIAAIEWATQHREQYNIRVINLSLVSNTSNLYLFDMLDAAVELAWLQGIVVVVAAGNAGPNAPITAPANDPFVITVGATDDKGTPSTADDTLASFSSYGTSFDGVSKPDLVAPGRHIVSTLSSPASPLALAFPSRIVANGHYIQLSGTSAAAPVVSGVVAQVLQARPNLNPGQVKWLLTHTSQAVAGPGTGAGYPRVGAAVNYSAPIGTTNTHRLPNLYLLAAYATKTGVAWNSVAWNDVAWNDVAWNDVAWNDVAWNDVAWNDVAWNDVAWLPTD